MSIHTSRRRNIDRVGVDTSLPPRLAGGLNVHLAGKRENPAAKITVPNIVEWNGKFYEVGVYIDGVEQNYTDQEWQHTTTQIANKLSRFAENCDPFNRSNFTKGSINLKDKTFRYTTERGETHRFTGSPTTTLEETTPIPVLESQFDELSLFFRNSLNAVPSPTLPKDDDIPHAVKRLKKEDGNDGQLQISDMGHYFEHLRVQNEKKRKPLYYFEYNAPIAWDRLPAAKKADPDYFYNEIVHPLFKNKVKGENRQKLLLNIPILIGDHYVDVVIDIPNKRIYYYDAFGCKAGSPGAVRYQDEFKAKLDQLETSLIHKFRDLYSSWKVVKNKIKHQKNSIDCGVHVLSLGEAMLNGVPFSHYTSSKPDISVRRKEIAESLAGKLPSSSEPWYKKAQFWKRG